MVVPSLYKPDPDYPALGAATAHLFDDDAPPHFWAESNYQHTWFIDALTIDPTELLSGEKGIWMRGVEQPVTQRKIENANIGSLPKILVYVAIHPKHGAHVFFPFHGAKHGGSAESKEQDKGMYEGYDFWHSELTEDEAQHLKSQRYYNMEHHSAVDGELLADPDLPFSPLNFTVRSIYTRDHVVLEQHSEHSFGKDALIHVCGDELCVHPRVLCFLLVLLFSALVLWSMDLERYQASPAALLCDHNIDLLQAAAFKSPPSRPRLRSTCLCLRLLLPLSLRALADLAHVHLCMRLHWPL